jgi:hypothetical protein
MKRRLRLRRGAAFIAPEAVCPLHPYQCMTRIRRGLAWKIGQDAHGCPMWIEPEVIDQQCCGCPFDDADYDAGLLDSDAGG